MFGHAGGCSGRERGATAAPDELQMGLGVGIWPDDPKCIGKVLSWNLRLASRANVTTWKQAQGAHEHDNRCLSGRGV